jgi:hypothetical protein
MGSTVAHSQVIEMTRLVSLKKSCVPLGYVSYGALFPISNMTRNIFQPEPEKSFDVYVSVLDLFLGGFMHVNILPTFLLLHC